MFRFPFSPFVLNFRPSATVPVLFFISLLVPSVLVLTGPLVWLLQLSGELLIKTTSPDTPHLPPPVSPPSVLQSERVHVKQTSAEGMMALVLSWEGRLRPPGREPIRGW